MEWSECQNLEVYLGSYCKNLARAYIKLVKYWKNAQLIPFWSPSLIPISDLPKIDQDYWYHKLLDISKNNMVQFLKLPSIQFCLSLTEKYILCWYSSTYCTLGLIEGVYRFYINEFEPKNLAIPTKKGIIFFSRQFWMYFDLPNPFLRSIFAQKNSHGWQETYCVCLSTTVCPLYSNI